MVLKIYRLTQDENTGYDTYDSAVVAAENPKEAQQIRVGSPDYTWAVPEKVKVELIGTAKRGVKKGILLASFHAG